MCQVRREVKVGLEPPSVERLKFVEEGRRHSSGDFGNPGRVDSEGREQDTEKYRRFTICIRSERIPDLANFAGIKRLRRRRHRFSELRLVYESRGGVHKIIMARA
jgi:hypothetical protein